MITSSVIVKASRLLSSVLKMGCRSRKLENKWPTYQEGICTCTPHSHQHLQGYTRSVKQKVQGLDATCGSSLFGPWILPASPSAAELFYVTTKRAVHIIIGLFHILKIFSMKTQATHSHTIQNQRLTLRKGYLATCYHSFTSASHAQYLRWHISQSDITTSHLYTQLCRKLFCHLLYHAMGR